MEYLIFNIGEIATLNYGDISKPLSGVDMYDREKLVLNPGNAILISNGIIKKISEEDELIEEFVPDYSNGKSDILNLVNAHGKAIIPGLVDCHTHLLWTGDRSNEMQMRQKGHSYQEISELGGGISRTVNSTRKASKDELISVGNQRLDQASLNGQLQLKQKVDMDYQLIVKLNYSKHHQRLIPKSAISCLLG